jgi:zinc protease
MYNKVFVAVLIFILLALPVHAQVFLPETTTLKNGMQVVVVPNHRAPVVTQMLWFKTGAINDPWGKSGIAHFLEHLMFKGTKNHAEGDYSKIISHMGGEENAFTSYDYTAFYATVGKEHLPEIMDLESDRLANWQVTDDQVKKELQVILKERQQRIENDPVSAFFEEVDGLMFANHPYQRPTIGWRAEMETLNRDDAVKYHDTYYAPNNVILVISGDITLKEIQPFLDKYYAPIPAKNVPDRVSPIVPELKSMRRVTENSPLVKERLWSKHFIVPAARPETIAQSDAMTVMTKILGDGRTGRLYRRLVMKEKLANAASVGFDSTSYGPARLSIAVTPTPDADLNKIEAIVNDELQKIAMEKVTPDELQKATQGLEVASVYARDSVTGPAMIIGESLVDKLDIKTIEAWPKRMHNITAAQVQEQAKTLWQKNDASVIAILLPEPPAEKAVAK